MVGIGWSQPRGRRAARDAFVAIACVGTFLVASSPAMAGKAVDRAFPASLGAPAGDAADGGVFSLPNDIVFNDPDVLDPGHPTANGDFYVVDTANQRVQRFNADETFDLAWGKDVIEPGGAGDTGTGFEVCTVALDCKAGVPGTLGGEMSTPEGIDVNQATGDVYVRERGNLRVQQFTADGAFVRAWGADVDSVSALVTFEKCEIAANCKIGTAGGAAGQFQASTVTGTGLAVSPVNGNVFVVDPGGGLTFTTRNRRLQEFEPDGDFVRAWGFGVDTGAGRFEICTIASTCQAALGQTSTGADSPGRFGGVGPTQQPLHIAVDSSGVVYTSDIGGLAEPNRVLRFDTTVVGDDEPAPTPNGTSAAERMLLPRLLGVPQGGPLIEGSTTAMEVDLDDDGAGPDVDRLFVARGQEIQELDVSSEPVTSLDVHMQSSGLDVAGIAIDPLPDDDPPSADEHEIYVSSSSAGANRVYVLDEDGAGVPKAVVNPALNVGAHSATLSGTVNPEGFPATFQFEYSKNGVQWTAVSPPEDLPVVAEPVDVTDEVTGLEANTVYKVRLVITKGFGAGTGVSGEQLIFTSAAAPDATTLPPNHRGTETATLAGRINPNGKPTSYHFEYGTSIGYGTRAPVPPADAGSGGVSRDVSQQIGGLAPDTTYHYRVVAESEEGTTHGADVAFRTREAAVAPPDERAYELVSPPDKLGGGGVGTHLPEEFAVSVPGLPSLDGERYAVQGAFGTTLLDGEFSYASDWAFAERKPGGWVSHSPFTRPNYAYGGARFAEVYGGSDDLSLIMWKSSGGRLSPFPEQAAWDDDLAAPALSDWSGKWEVFGPTHPDQGDSVGARGGAVSADGSRAVMNTNGVGSTEDDWHGGLGLTGAPLVDQSDPVLDQVTGRAAYVDDLPNGVSDTFPGSGIRRPIGVCSAGTLLPNVDGGDIGTRPCPAPFEYAPGQFRSGSLTSTQGAAFPSAPQAISDDGSRIFYTSPDTNSSTPCSGTGVTTSCPAQVYVRQVDPQSGAVTVRWISRPQVAGQDSALLGPAHFEGASIDGDKVFFRTNSPLTSDDPNAACGAPCTAGAASDQSWDLYMYDIPDGPDGDPSTADGDPAGGTLTRITGGPGGTSDPSILPPGSASESPLSAALRFASEDGQRVYFTAAAPIANAVMPPSGTVTSPGSAIGETNLYVYDSTKPVAQRWEFVARLPRSTTGIAACATTAARFGDALSTTTSRDARTTAPFTCMRGTSDAKFVTFMTKGRLLAGDPDAASIDIYAYDATDRELLRITAPQGGPAASYECIDTVPEAGTRCFGDGGIGSGEPTPHPRLGVVTDPATPGDRVAFFQSKSRLVSEDADDVYDVYQWRNGELSLLSAGTSQGAYYTGSSTDGKDVFVMTRDKLSWQDVDAVFDIYDLRVGGGIPQPPSHSECEVLADACQGPTAAPPSHPNDTGRPGGGDLPPTARATLAVGGVSGRERARAARTGTLRLRVRSSVPGKVTVVARAKLGRRTRRVASGSKTMSKPGAGTVRLRLNRAARARLRAGKALRMSLTAAAPGARKQTATVTLKRAGR